VGRCASRLDLAGTAAAFPFVGGLSAITLGASALAGWTQDTTPLTGIGICLCGTALQLLAPETVGGGRRAAGRVAAGAAVVLATGTLAAYASETSLGGGVSWLPEVPRAGTGYVAEIPTMASAIAIVCVGVALVVKSAGRRGRAVPYLAGAVLAVALWALIAHLLEGRVAPATAPAETLRRAFTPMPVSSAVAFCLLALGTLAARPDRAPMALVRGGDAGAFMARRALVPIATVPIVFAWLRLEGERAGLYPEPIGISLGATSTVVALVAVVFWNARALRRLDGARLRTANALRQARTELDLALASGAVAIWTLRPAEDPVDDRVFGDARLAALFAVPPETLRDGAPLETLETRIHPDDRARVAAAMRQAIDRRMAYEQEYRIVGPDGSVRWVVARGVCDMDPLTGRLRFPGTVVDVTERRRAEDEQRLLAAAGLLLSASLDPDRAGAAVVDLLVPTLADWCVVDVVDAEGRPRAVGVGAVSEATRIDLDESMARDPDAAVCFGSVAARVLGVDGPGLIVDRAGDPSHAALLATLHAGSALVLPLRARDRRLGTVLVAGSTTGRRFDSRDLALGVDLARRAALAIDNALLYRASCTAIEMREQVLGVVAHDLRNPVASIAMNVEVLARSRGKDGVIEQLCIARTRAAVSQADRLIRDLLEVARLDAGKLQLTLHREPLVPVLQEAVELHRTLSDAAGHTVDVEVSGDLEPVLMDRDRILQVLSNLLGNAIKFTPAGGRIRVSAGAVAGGVRVEVADSGPGLLPENLPHLFRPFWQAQRGGGAGLGLAIAKGIVEAHGGRIGAECESGGGARLWFTLPAGAAVPVDPGAGRTGMLPGPAADPLVAGRG
jgi:signal transduction histidine kinase/PAS domain-containing protein